MESIEVPYVLLLGQLEPRVASTQPVQAGIFRENDELDISRATTLRMRSLRNIIDRVLGS